MKKVVFKIRNVFGIYFLPDLKKFHLIFFFFWFYRWKSATKLGRKVSSNPVGRYRVLSEAANQSSPSSRLAIASLLGVLTRNLFFFRFS